MRLSWPEWKENRRWKHTHIYMQDKNLNIFEMTSELDHRVPVSNTVKFEFSVLHCCFFFFATEKLVNGAAYLRGNLYWKMSFHVFSFSSLFLSSFLSFYFILFICNNAWTEGKNWSWSWSWSKSPVCEISLQLLPLLNHKSIKRHQRFFLFLKRFHRSKEKKMQWHSTCDIFIFSRSLAKKKFFHINVCISIWMC